MFPPDAIVFAASRWLRLLKSSSLGRSSEIIRAGAGFADLTQTQYSSGLEWLRNSKLLTEGAAGLELSQSVRELPKEQLSQLFFQRVLEQATPAWLPDADVLVEDPSELPQDAAALAAKLGLSDLEAFAAIKQLHGRIDLTQRARVGAAGELALVELLERQWPGSTTHVAKTDDGFGYDVVFRHTNINWHLEVKTTIRRGRLMLYLSRHEHEVGLRDPEWRLIVVGLDNKMRPRAVATVNHSEVLARAPKDLYSEAKWQSVSHNLTSRDISPGLSFANGFAAKIEAFSESASSSDETNVNYSFSWMP